MNTDIEPTLYENWAEIILETSLKIYLNNISIYTLWLSNSSRGQLFRKMSANNTQPLAQWTRRRRQYRAELANVCYLTTVPTLTLPLKFIAET